MAQTRADGLTTRAPEQADGEGMEEAEDRRHRPGVDRALIFSEFATLDLVQAILDDPGFLAGSEEVCGEGEERGLGNAVTLATTQLTGTASRRRRVRARSRRIHHDVMPCRMMFHPWTQSNDS